VGIFKVHSVDRSKDPVDVRDKISLKQLKHYRHYETTTHCSGGTSKYCNLVLIWDVKNSAPYRTFVGLLSDDTVLPDSGGKKVKTFVLLDSNLFRNLIGDPSAY
jgi:hypothetical protein